MAVLTVRNVDDETRAGLKALGAAHGRSMESEARAILAEAVRLHQRTVAAPGLGSQIQALFADADWPGVDRRTDEVRAASFEET